MVNVFAVPVFFIVFRETIETSIIVASLLSFLKQTLGDPKDQAAHKRLVKQVWIGTALGLFICLAIGGAFIGVFNTLGRDLWANSEDLYEGIFCLIASVIITIMGAAMLRVSKLQAKWKLKLTEAAESGKTKGLGAWGRKYAMFLLPFITVLREGLEAVVFVGGISLNQPAKAFPLPVVMGLAGGCVIGYIIYRGGNTVRLQYFLIASTCLLYLVSAGLFSRAAWGFDTYQYVRLVGGDVAETGDGPGSYNIHRTVWHINCCNPESGNGGGGWGIFNSILGWQNSATYSSVVTYNLYWIVVSAWFVIEMWREKNGRYPFMKKAQVPSLDSGDRGVFGNTESKEVGGNVRVAESPMVEL